MDRVSRAQRVPSAENIIDLCEILKNIPQKFFKKSYAFSTNQKQNNITPILNIKVLHQLAFSGAKNNLQLQR